MTIAESVKQRARRLVRDAMKRGILVRPNDCPRCGAITPTGSDGRSTLHAHHEDYSRPLHVEWLCAACHRAETPINPHSRGISRGDANGMRKYPGLMRGSKNSFAKLDESDVAAIKAQPSSSVRTLAKQFGVRPTTIYDIRLGRRWAHVSAAAPKVVE